MAPQDCDGQGCPRHTAELTRYRGHLLCWECLEEYRADEADDYRDRREAGRS